MLTHEELSKIEKYLEGKPSLKHAGVIKYLRNNYLDESTVPNRVETPLQAAAKGVRRADDYICNPNKPGTAPSDQARRGVYVRTAGDSQLGDRK